MQNVFIRELFFFVSKWLLREFQLESWYNLTLFGFYWCYWKQKSHMIAMIQYFYGLDAKFDLLGVKQSAERWVINQAG